ncbi:shikimate kinase AroK [Ketobacter alkanivorans]|uniref:Shikimate kinase n=1 Tax=Ketobacter alkanivorans TaxID=1917421 RepID=A0A2K9LNB5_9GAMM|nr:shikimate kinase AroK [Ketobacter alkanivorans]AUM13772.1 shikimate kinase I [Ketobacter alkanivorans]
MSKHGNVILVGPMGAGKSTIGRQLAQALSYEFVDSDHEIEARTGADIPWIFDVEGEEGFRRREETVIDELTQRDGIVLATGGGAITREANRRAISARGIVVYLKTSIEQQLARTAKDRKRPLLQHAEPRKVLTELMKTREPLYLEVADHVVDTDASNIKDVALTISDLVTQAI